MDKKLKTLSETIANDDVLNAADKAEIKEKTSAELLEELRRYQKSLEPSVPDAYENQNSRFKALIEEACTEYRLGLKAYVRYQNEQKIQNPDYSIFNPDYSNDALKFGLKWIEYTDSIARRRGRHCNVCVNGRDYVFSLGQRTLILAKDEGMLHGVFAMNTFNNVPKNMNQYLNDPQRRRDYILRTAE